MKLSEQKQYYEEASGTVSDITRGLNYSLIAIVWILCGKDFNNLPDYKCILFFIILSLLFDIIQYFWRTIACFACFRCNEKECIGKDAEATKDQEQDEEVGNLPTYIAVVAWILWGIKIAAMTVAAVMIIAKISA